MPKLRIEEAATRKQARVDAGIDVVVGTNKYQLDHEEPIDVLQIDNSAVRESQINRLASIKASRDENAVEEALMRLGICRPRRYAYGAGDNPQNLLNLAVNAARVRCTLGEISEALKGVWGEHIARSDVVTGAYAQQYTSAEDEWSITMLSKLLSNLLRKMVADHACWCAKWDKTATIVGQRLLRAVRRPRFRCRCRPTIPDTNGSRAASN